MSVNRFKDSTPSIEGQEPPIEWQTIGVAVPKDMVPRIKNLALRRGLNASTLGRTLFIAALDADKAA